MSEGLQNVTQPAASTDEAAVAVQKEQAAAMFKWQLDQWISFCAVGGLITEADGELRPTTVSDFADQIQIARKTLYEWRKRPGFWDAVEKRRAELFTKDRIAKVWNGLFLKAATGNAEAAKLILGQYAGWQPPQQKHEIQVNGVMDVVQKARQRREATEGEIIDQSS